MVSVQLAKIHFYLQEVYCSRYSYFIIFFLFVMLFICQVEFSKMNGGISLDIYKNRYQKESSVEFKV